MHRHIALVVLLFSLPALAWGQSLGDAARKERERREKNKAQGVEAREISETEIFGEDEEDSADGTEETAAEDGEDERPSRTRPRFNNDLTPPEPDEDQEESSNRARDEAEWRSRLEQAKKRIEDAREQVQFLEGLSLMPGGSYVDTQGRTVIRSLEHLKALVRMANEELALAEQALPEIREEARRAGVPPGWLR